MRPWLPLCLALLVVLTLPQLRAQTPTHKPGGFHSPDLEPGSSWNLTLVREGIYYYHCHPHPFMRGVIEVTFSGSNGAAVEAKEYKFTPDRVKIQPGTNVTWTNRDAVVHTIDESIPPAGSPTAADGTGTPGPALGATLAVALIAAALYIRRSRP